MDLSSQENDFAVEVVKKEMPISRNEESKDLAAIQSDCVGDFCFALWKPTRGPRNISDTE